MYAIWPEEEYKSSMLYLTSYDGFTGQAIPDGERQPVDVKKMFNE